jgi:hypothetical protein
VFFCPDTVAGHWLNLETATKEQTEEPYPNRIADIDWAAAIAFERATSAGQKASIDNP